MYRVRVTLLESFRKMLNDQFGYFTEEKFLADLTGTFEGNYMTRVGEAFMKIIEEGLPKMALGAPVVQILLSDGWTVSFSEAQAQLAMDYRAARTAAIYEVPLKHIYSDLNALISLKVDVLEGKKIRDVKLKFSTVDYEQYLESYQWRYYLTAFGLDVFAYDVFQVYGFKEPAEDGQEAALKLLDVSRAKIVPHEPLECYRYPEMERDCWRLLHEFKKYIRETGRLDLLKKATIEDLVGHVLSH